MKKMLKLEGKNMLNKEQLREIKGGYDCGSPDGCGVNGYWACTDGAHFPGQMFYNCIGGTYYSCTFVDPTCDWHPGSN